MPMATDRLAAWDGTSISWVKLSHLIEAPSSTEPSDQLLVLLVVPEKDATTKSTSSSSISLVLAMRTSWMLNLYLTAIAKLVRYKRQSKYPMREAIIVDGWAVDQEQDNVERRRRSGAFIFQRQARRFVIKRDDCDGTVL